MTQKDHLQYQETLGGGTSVFIFAQFSCKCCTKQILNL